MADEGNEDSWLYGCSNPEGGGEKEDTEEATEENRDDFDIDKRREEDERPQQEDSNTYEAAQTEENGANEDQTTMDDVTDAAEQMEEQENVPNVKEKGENGSDSDDSDDDDINVVIGDIKSGLSYNIKQRGNLLAPNAAAVNEKMKQSTGKFSMEDFESVGTISGVPATEFSIDSLEEKPWRMPGADITDYFNYGFNEDTWRSYCERQKKMRLNESGVGLQGLALGPVTGITPGHGRTLTPLSNDNSKYTSIPGGLRRAGPPPGRKMTGSIDVIGSNGISSRREDGLMGKAPSKENAIQVMTADRREYSRVGGKFDAPITGGFSGETQPIGHFYEQQETYNYGYEPTQDSQWNNNAWQPSGIKELTPGLPQMVPPPLGVPGMSMPIQAIGHVQPPMMGQLRYDEDRERDRRSKYRERSGRRERSRSRERSERSRDRDRERLLTEREIKQEPVDRDDESPSRDKDRRAKYRERSSRRERSRSRERSERSRRSRSRTRDRRSRGDKKKSHKRDKDDSE
uniref:Putative polyadenylation factor i complex subunit fip1 n=1 Tax=Phlebotomus kandelakii TaxID=1109342 RepID=A0A6B2EDJ7_9DIPT